MEPWLIVLLSILGTVVVFFALWLFLIAPKARPKAVQPFLCPYAHRGLWGEGVPENSLAAFEAAAKAGFGIELDVQLSADGTVMVFHDYTLERMCTREGLLSELSAEELANIPLNGARFPQFIPTLQQVLAVVKGRVPLLIELKGESGDTALVPALVRELADYQGVWCVESFNPLLLRAMKKEAPQTVRGLLSTNLLKDGKKGNRFLNFALSAMLFNFLCRPAFHAWNGHYPNRPALRVGLKWFGAASFVFTVRDPEAYARYMAQGIYPIFDGFLPK